jgi:two-component system response regulator YesN
LYKLIILDDEETIRKGLVDLIAWGDMGFEVTGDFEDGHDAIRYLRSHEVDVVLTDVIMAEVSGLEVASFINREMPQVKVVIISGYKEFEYAQQAIQHNVSHYLLKPTKLDEIYNVFKQLKLELDREAEVKAEEKRNRELLPILQEQFFTDLLMGALRDPEEMRKRIEWIHLPFSEFNGCCVVDINFQLENGSAFQSNDEKDKVWLGLRKLFKNHEGRPQIQFYPVQNHIHGFKIVAVYAKDLDLGDSVRIVEEQLNKINRSIESVFDVTIETTIETVYNNLAQLANYSEKIQFALQESGGTLHLDHDEYEKIVYKYKLFISNIIEGNMSEVSSLLDRFLEEFHQVPPKFFHRLIKDLFSIIQHTFEQGGVDVQGLTGKILHHDMEVSGFDEIRDLSRNTLAEVIQNTADQKNHSSSLLIEKAQRFMQVNFDQDLSLDSVADHIFLHPVYFSKLFKQYAKINFSEYLTNLRIQKAITLLSQRKFKMYEVGQKVGYPNGKYFNRVFKQITGYTPKEYCRK